MLTPRASDAHEVPSLQRLSLDVLARHCDDLETYRELTRSLRDAFVRVAMEEAPMAACCACEVLREEGPPLFYARVCAQCVKCAPSPTDDVHGAVDAT